MRTFEKEIAPAQPTDENVERGKRIDRTVKEIVALVNRLFRRPDWKKIETRIRDNELYVDPEGTVRFRGDRLTKRRFS